MRLGITGTYSSGKTLTALAVAHLTGLPRTEARTMREILPEAAPGKTLEQVSAAELIQMIVIRHVDRAVHENRLAPAFVSDGCSLQEWIYGKVRVAVGINPNASAGLAEGETVARTPELEFFDQVMDQIGAMVRRHVAGSFDAFVHLENELPLAADGHRPVNDRFRTMSDEYLRTVLAEIGMPVHVVSGGIPERLDTIVRVLDLPTVLDVEEAIERAERDYAAIDVRIETLRGHGAPPGAVAA